MKAARRIWKYSKHWATTTKSLQSCLTLCDPVDGSPPGSPVPGVLQARTLWSGLPFPSPMHESEKWKWSRSVVSDSLWPCGLQPTRLLHPWDFPGKSTGVGCHCLLQNIGQFSSSPSKLQTQKTQKAWEMTGSGLVICITVRLKGETLRQFWTATLRWLHSSFTQVIHI